jgi:HSP20 family protein
MPSMLTRRTPNELANRNDLFNPLLNIRETLDAMFNDLFSGNTMSMSPSTTMLPPVNMHQEGENLVIEAMMPGIDKENLHLTCDRNVLMISGELKQSLDRKDQDFLRREFVHGSLHRSITLPMDVDPSKIKATLKNGLLRIMLPQHEEARRQKVNIKVD